MILFFVVVDLEEIVSAPNIIDHYEAYLIECEYETDVESENGSSDNDMSDDEEYNFDELELIKMQKTRKGPYFMVKTLKINHNFEDAYKNPRACTTSLAQYFNNKENFLDDYNRIEVYANELILTNPDSHILINLSKYRLN
ncbi:hypothetical protein H5410_022589 [Solanum commersonii]|uniref:Uncharacterized protein n=1 Tax=Solanum commersonii TaxID=4109 RepID=A0A9J5ZIA2_SOLCO|nr:hypothetical protein H5410_022589 [Solanum commersonii]